MSPITPSATSFACKNGSPLSLQDQGEWSLGDEFSCYSNYYRLLTAKAGASVAIADLKDREKNDLYVEQICHELTHVIGRSAGESA
ncbi:hypothetical protein L0Y46_04090, partial [bacterium]|nr:hypothetical protein [bacterium]